MLVSYKRRLLRLIQIANIFKAGEEKTTVPRRGTGHTP